MVPKFVSMSGTFHSVEYMSDDKLTRLVSGVHTVQTAFCGLLVHGTNGCSDRKAYD